MARRLRQQIEAWGGSFRWGTTVSDIIIEHGACGGVILDNGERIRSDCTLIAAGHSARDLITTLVGHNIDHKAKGFQLGCRIEHDQTFINQMRYGMEQPPRHLLHAAEYNLVSRPPAKVKAEGITTFCMCPGGEIIAATSDRGQLSTNGMSPHHRRGRFANAGLICNQPVFRDGNGLDGFERIADLERAAFVAGGSNYSAPAQSAASFMRGETGKTIGDSSYDFGTVNGRIDKILPQQTVHSLRQALKFFERKLRFSHQRPTDWRRNPRQLTGTI